MATDIPELHFRAGLPGFPESRRFALVRWGANEGPYSVLVDLDDTDIRFLVAPPALFFPQYEIELDDRSVGQLALGAADEALVLMIVTLGEKPEDATANLLGPIVINTSTREGIQVVLPEAGWSTKVPLLAA
ncbi:MAG: flagellar assembly factor FliW [Frankiaceae bacterium]|nr:flagellar assembly factor FliW [Frankiaceae bacterium]